MDFKVSISKEGISKRILKISISNFIKISKFITGIIKSDITDHFPIFLISNKINLDTHSENKRFIDEKSTSKFKSLVSKVNWNGVNQIYSPNEAYNSFILKKLIVYEEAFHKVKTKIKKKNLLSPWII